MNMHYVLSAVVSLKFCHCRLHVSCVLVRLLLFCFLRVVVIF